MLPGYEDRLREIDAEYQSALTALGPRSSWVGDTESQAVALTVERQKQRDLAKLAEGQRQDAGSI
jgi:hypothetical protein